MCKTPSYWNFCGLSFVSQFRLGLGNSCCCCFVVADDACIGASLRFRFVVLE